MTGTRINGGMSSALQEGMRENDLADLVLPLLSVDEYQSKVDPEEAIVIGFYVQDKAAAKDLNRFLQKSAVPLLGTDTSPAPDQHGYFMVFVEFMNNQRLAENVDAILQELKSLVDVEHWQMRVRGHDRLLRFSPDNLTNVLETTKKQSKKSEVIEFLQPSALNDVSFDEDAAMVVLEGGGQRYAFDFVDLDSIPSLMRQHRLSATGLQYDIRTIARTNKIGGMLGEAWDVSRIGAYLMLHRQADPRGLLLRL